MLLNYSAMFTIILMLSSFVTVYCQAPLAFNLPFTSSSESDLFSGLGSSSATVVTSGSSQLYSGVDISANKDSVVSSSRSVSAISPVTNMQLPLTSLPSSDPNVELFAHSLLMLLLTSPVLNAVPGFVITDPYTTIYKTSTVFLEREEDLNLNKPILTEFVAVESRNVGVITEYLHYNTIAHVMSKLLYFNNLLTHESIITYPRIIVSYMEAHGIKDGVFDADSALSAVAKGFMDFIKAAGINNESNINLIYQLYVKYLKDLAAGREI